MINENPGQDLMPAVLKRELTVLEYGTCADHNQAALLYEHRQLLQPYLDRRWLTYPFWTNQRAESRRASDAGRGE